MSDCPECKACEIVEGVLIGFFNKILFDPGQKRGYKVMFQSGVKACRNAKCCAVCGLVWTDLNVEDLKKYILTKCNEKFASKIYNSGDPESSSQANCVNCGLKGKITGELFSVDYSASVSFKPNNLIIYKFNNLPYIEIEQTSGCCTNCGLITTRLNSKEINRILLKYCKPKYLKQIYSCDE